MLEFFKRQPNVVEHLLSRIESPPFGDLILCILKLHERPGTGGVLEVSSGQITSKVINHCALWQWMSSQGLVPRLVEFLSPLYSMQMQNIACELLRSVITLSSPSQAQSSRAEGLP